MVSRFNAELSEIQSAQSGQHAPEGVTVFGQADRTVVDEVDRVADQMLMPRSWVIAQILKQWFEQRRSMELDMEQSWSGSYREVAGQAIAV